MAVVQKNNVREYKIDLDGSAGNAFYLLGTAQGLCRDLGLDGNKVIDEMKSGDYTNLVKSFDNYFGSFVTLETSDENFTKCIVLTKKGLYGKTRT